MQGLLARAALPVHAGAAHGLGEAGGQRGVAADVDALLADLPDAAHDDVLDQRGIDARALDQRLQRVCGQIDGVDGLEGSGVLTAAERGADGADDDCFAHGMVSLAELGWAPGGAAHD